jgi:E3 ubiquitin-protein ligase FANCL
MPRENLEVLLELSNGFPSPVTVTKDEMNIECGICYSFRFDGHIPDQLCSHSKCQQPFHRVCLYEVQIAM